MTLMIKRIKKWKVLKKKVTSLPSHVLFKCTAAIVLISGTVCILTITVQIQSQTKSKNSTIKGENDIKENHAHKKTNDLRP